MKEILGIINFFSISIKPTANKAHIFRIIVKLRGIYMNWIYINLYEYFQRTAWVFFDLKL